MTTKEPLSDSKQESLGRSHDQVETADIADTVAIEKSLTLLAQRSTELFEQSDKSNTFLKLLNEAKLRLTGDTSLALQGQPDDLQNEELQGLAELVHAIASFEDHVAEIRHAAENVMDWISKGGRSLGLD